MSTTLEQLAQFTLRFPFFVVFLTAIIVWLFRSKYPHDTERLLSTITFSSSLVLLIVSFWMLFFEQQEVSWDWLINIHIGAFSIVNLSLGFRIDALSIFTILLINVVAFAASWNSLAYLAAMPSSSENPWWQQKTGYHVLINLFHFTMLLVPLTNNLVIAWIAIELTTVGSAILIVYEGRKSSWEATWKYLIITSTGIVLALLGTIFLATNNATGLTPANPEQRLEWTFLMDNAAKLHPQLVWFAFLLALVGYGTKAGLAPLHTWLPDGHGEAPAPISALLSGVLLKASFYVILRFYILTNAVLGSIHPDWTSHALLIAGLVSLFVATPFILKENLFKRVLAYHSLEHMGIIAFGFGIGGPIAIVGALLHMLNHAITKALMFLAYGNVARNYNYGGTDIPIAGALRTMPWSGGLLTLGGLALVGTPPFNIFMSELIILWGALLRFIPGQSPIQPNYPKWIAGIAVAVFVISTTLIFFGLVNHLKKQVLGKTEMGDLKEHFTFTWSSISSIVPILFLFTLMLLLGIWIFPQLANLVHESVIIVLNVQKE